LSIASGVDLLIEAQRVAIGLRSSYLNYVSPVSQQKDVLNAVRSSSIPMKVLTVGKEGSRSIGISIYSNVMPFQNEVRSMELNFHKVSTVTFSPVRHYLCDIVVSLKQDLNELRVAGLWLVATFDSFSGVRSKNIQVSIYRDIIDFQIEDATALQFGILASSLDLSDKSIQMKINFGSNLCLLKNSRYKRIMNPFIPKVEDDTIFNIGESDQQISVTSKSRLFDLSKSEQQGLNTGVAEDKLPWLNRASTMLNISVISIRILLLYIIL